MRLGTHHAGTSHPPLRARFGALLLPLLFLAGLAAAAPSTYPASGRQVTGYTRSGPAQRNPSPLAGRASSAGLIGVAAATAPSPTGRTPRLLWTPQQQAVWNRMRAENNIWWQVLKSNADRSATPQRRAGDMGVWGTLAYQVTGDSTYARKAWTMITTGANGGSYLDPSFMPVDGRNFTREAFVDFVWMYDWLYPALSADERQLFIKQLNRWGDMVLNKLPGVTWGTRLSDSDETVGHYFGLAFLDLATAPDNPRAGTFLNSVWSESSTGGQLAVGGLTATGSNLTSTMRNAIRRYVEMSEGGQWVESSEYNMNTMRILLWGARGVHTATGTDYFPEITRFAPQLGLAQIHEVTPDLAGSYQWGDVQQPRNIEIWLRANLVGTLSGWLQQDTATGPLLQQLTDELAARYPHITTTSSSLPASFFLFFNPYASRSDWRGMLPKGYLARGYGFQFFHDGWDAGSSFFGANFAPSPTVDHGLAYLNTFQLYRKGEWAVTHPIGYQRNHAEYLNSMLIGGLSSANEFKGPLAQEFGPADEYAYFAGGTGGQFYRQPYWNPPPTFLHEWTRSLFYLPSADKLSDTIIVFDRTNAENPRNLPLLDRYLSGDRERILAASANKQWIIHSPVAPTVSPDGIAWSTARGQRIRVSTLLPAAQKRLVLDETQLWGNTVAASERGFQTRIVPSTEQRWDTFLNVIQASDDGASLRNTLVRSTAGEAEGVRVERAGHNDALVLFSAAPTRRMLRYGYSLNWTAVTAVTEAFLLDLDPTVTWTASLDGGTAVPVAVSSQGVGRIVFRGAGARQLTLRSSAPADDMPPSTPTGLSGSPSENSVTLNWSANSEPDLAGYHVFRSEDRNGPFLRQTETPLKAPGFGQTGLANGITYWFRLCAIDTSGNESAMSAALGVTPGTPTFNIRGTVSQDGAPLANITVKAGDYSAVTTSTGAYVISGVPAATYTVSATATGIRFSDPRVVTVGPDASNVNFTAAGTDGVKINSGGSRYNSTTSGSWLADTYVTGGAKFTYSGREIVGTTDDGLYLSVRYGKSFTYQVPVAPGSYTVKLHFAECWFTSPGNRRFDVLINGGSVLSNFDIVADGGPNAAVVKAFEVAAGETGIAITFKDVKNDALVSAIEVEPIRSFSISGRVSLNTGSAEGVLISAGGKSASTQADGTYTIADVEPGTYTVTAAKPEYTFSGPRTVTIGPDQTGIDFTGVQNTYAISGRITASGAGLAGATISTGNRSVTTDATGAYSLAGLPAGSYTVTAAANEHLVSAAQTVTVGPDRTNVNFTAVRKTYRVSGTVTVGGAGLPGAAITAGGQQVTTSANGTYVLENLVSGTYTVTATLAEYTFSAPAAVTLGPDRQGVDFTGVRNTYTVGGIVAVGGVPLPGVTVAAGGRTAVSGKDGRYELSGLTSGTYEATAQLAEYTFNSPRSVTLGPSRADVDFNGTRITYAVSGKVTSGGAALAGVTVTAGEKSASTGPDGTYQISGLISGSYQVRAAKAEFTFDGERTITLGPSRSGVDFTGTQITYQVSGTVRDGNRGIAGVTVSAGGVTATTGGDGGYTLAGLVAGTYTVECSRRGYAFDGPHPVTLGPSRTGVDFARRPVVSPASFRLTDGKPVMGGSALDLEFTANGAKVTAAACDLAFDPALVAFVGAKAGSLPSGVSVQANQRVPGRVRVVIFGATTAWSSGRIASVTFAAAPGAPGEVRARVELKLPDTDENGVQVSDPEGLSANASGTGGSVAFASGMRGDLNRNGIIDVGDVQLLLNVVLGLTAYDPAQHDLNDNGGIDIGDVQSLANLFLGGGSPSSMGMAPARRKSGAGRLTAYRLGLKPGKSEVTAVAFDLNLAGTTLEEVSATLQRSDVQFSHRTLSNGLERVLIYSTNGTPLPATKNMCLVRVRGKGRVKAVRPATGTPGGDGALADGTVVGVSIPMKK